MPLAYHVVLGAYGFWLPNDPRGSWSDFVGSLELLRFGAATKIATTRSVASVAHDDGLRRAAKQALKFPVVRFTGRQALAVAQGFRQACEEGAYVAFACAVLPEHAHLVIRHHERENTRIVGHLKSHATRKLRESCLWNDNRPVWSKRCWKVFLNDEETIRRAINYVEKNPLKEGKPAQRWSFVTPFDPPPRHHH